ncbi:MAG: FAD-dependent oxidoreductase [Pseudomonadota bacterium]
MHLVRGVDAEPLVVRIAVVGSGIAGLSAAWLLSKKHHVTLFEKFDHLGMDAHSIALPGEHGGARIDVPLRVFFDGFYPNLTALYQELGAEYKPVNYSASFGTLNDNTYFRYDNYRAGRFAFPFLKGTKSLNRKALRISWDILRLFRESPKSIARGIADDITLQSYLDAHHYSTAFAEGFLYPAFCGICTCSHESIKTYPARVILEYLNSGLLLSSVRRVTLGTQEVVTLLAGQVHDVKLGVTVTGVGRTDGGATVRTTDSTSTFDHVVLATQANQSEQILENASPEERQLLASFSYEPSRVVVHKDTRLAPPGGPAQWAPVNFLLAKEDTAPMATIWMNAIQSIPGADPVFQTWNPVIEADPSLVLGEARFERPVVNAASLGGLQRLTELHEQPDRRIWFCGSYAAHGIPLLESATTSAASIAQRFGSQRPWAASNER